MTEHGPDITVMIHHLGECPVEFQMEPRIGKAGVIVTEALVQDTLRRIHGKLKPEPEPRSLQIGPQSREHLLAVQIGCWLFSHEWFLGKAPLVPELLRFLGEVLPELASHVTPEAWVRDMERREEFCRLALATCQLVPLSETDKQALERFESVSTLKRKNILSKTAAAFRRMKKIREQMAREAAREAANVYGRE